MDTEVGGTGKLSQEFSGVCVTPDRKVGVGPGTGAEKAYGRLTDIGAEVSLGNTGNVGEFKAIGDGLRSAARKPDTGKCGPGAVNTGIKL